MKSTIGILIIIAAIGTSAYWFITSSYPDVRVAPVRRALAVNAVSGNANVQPVVNLTLKSDTKGRVVQTCVPTKSGPKLVKAGDIIIQLDPTEIQHDIEFININLEAAKASYDEGSIFDSKIADAQAELDVHQKLAANGQFSQTELDTLQRNLKSLILQKKHETIQNKKEIALFEKKIEKKQNELKRLSIRSPIDGYVTEIYTPTGDLVFDGTAVSRVISTDRIIEVSINEEDFIGIDYGQSVTLRLMGYGNELLEGKVDVILAESDPHSKRRSIYVALNNPDIELSPGMTGQASITKAERDNALVVPRRALLGDTVLVVKEGIIEAKTIEPGFLSINLAEVQSGLYEGDLVIVETPQLFRHGEHVNIN